MKYRYIAPKYPNLSITETILTNRGINLNDINHYLNTNDDDVLSPILLDNMEAGAKLLIKHIKAKHKIFVQIDTDVDGLTSSALLINYLYRLFPTYVDNYIIYRNHINKQHGIIIDTIPEDVKLVIAPDSSSELYTEHQALKNRGIDILILDHHTAPAYSDFACVINNQLSEKYINKELSGVGVVYKFCSYLDSILDINLADEFLDLVALGNIADMVSLQSIETKHLIQQGLKNIKNPYFKLMIQKQEYSMKGRITPFNIAFYIAPTMNAVMRIGSIENRNLLFESLLEHKAYQSIPSTKRGAKLDETEALVEQAVRISANVKAAQTKMRDKSLEYLESLITDELLNNKILVLCVDDVENIDRGIVGLMANQIMAKYQHPVLILVKTEHEDSSEIFYDGSGRNYGLPDFQQFVKESGYAEFASGHPGAFGASFKRQNIQQFIEYANNTLKDYNFEPSYDVDFIFDAKKDNTYDIFQIASMDNLWGQNITEPYVAMEHLSIDSNNCKLLKETTIRITIPNQDLTLIKFKSNEEEYNKMIQSGSINIVGRCQINEWGGQLTPQILIEDYELVSKKFIWDF